MNKYKSPGFKSVKADTMKEAAEIFANRAARRTYGPKGYCRTLKMNSHSQDGDYAEFFAFVGYTSAPNATTGHNFAFSVYSV